MKSTSDLKFKLVCLLIAAVLAECCLECGPIFAADSPAAEAIPGTAVIAMCHRIFSLFFRTTKMPVNSLI